MTINVSEALDSDTAEIITVERQNGNYVDGVYVFGTPIIFKTLASVQQPTSQQLERIPPGQRTTDMRLFISKKPIRGADDRNNIPADIILHKSKRYTVISLGDWQSYGFSSAIGAA